MNTNQDTKTKTEKQKMIDEEYFNPCEKELVEDRIKAKEICFDYNQLRPTDKEKRKELIKKLFKKTGTDFHIESNFYCDYGYNITIGENFYSNHNLVILDGCEVTFGNYVLIGPNCGFYTAAHPIDVDLRNECVEFGKIAGVLSRGARVERGQPQGGRGRQLYSGVSGRWKDRF